MRIIEIEKFRILEYFLPGITSSGADIKSNDDKKGTDEKINVKIIFSFKVPPQRLTKYSLIKSSTLSLTAGTNFIVPALGWPPPPTKP